MIKELQKKKRSEYQKVLRYSLEKIFNVLLPRAERINVFRYYPKKEPDLFTDLDILIIMETDKPFLERMKEIYELLIFPVDADLFCYTSIRI